MNNLPNGAEDDGADQIRPRYPHDMAHLAPHGSG